MAKTIGFRPTQEDERIIHEAMQDDERTADVIRGSVTIVPTSTQAQPAAFRPELELGDPRAVILVRLRTPAIRNRG